MSIGGRVGGSVIGNTAGGGASRGGGGGSHDPHLPHVYLEGGCVSRGMGILEVYEV